MESINTHWPEIIKQLNTEIYFKNLGSIITAHPHDHVELKRFISKIKDKYLLCDTNISIENLEPELKKFHHAYYFSEEAHIDTQAVMKSLYNFFQHTHIKLYENVNINPADIKDHNLVFDCRGLGAASIFKDLYAIRGELLWLHAPQVKILRPIRLLHTRYNLYVVPRPENIYLVGATEIMSEDYSRISVHSCLELLTAVYYLHAGFAEARIIKTVTQCRPTLPHHHPKIFCHANLIAINGLYRHGFLIAPSLVADVMRWIEGGKSAIQYPSLWEGL